MKSGECKAPPQFHWYYMGLYYPDCVKSIYKGAYKPSQIACPKTWKYVYLTEEIKEKVKGQGCLQLATEESESTEGDFPYVDPKKAKELGMRSELQLEDGGSLNIF